jgi:predicted AAA+ superfamily ATPase
MESKVLERDLQGEPTSVLVLVGPRSCGKTTLLKQVCCLAANFLAYSGAQFGVEIPINLLFVRYLV